MKQLTPPSRARRPAFTLLELMISIALALMLIYGISKVFKLSGDTVGTQQAMATIVRDSRAASATMLEDFRNAAADTPLFLISSRIAYGYGGPGNGFRAGWKSADEVREAGAAGTNPDPTQQEVNGTAYTIPFTRGTDRTPRVDRLAFFAQNQYRRQTAGGSQVAGEVTSTDAYIWYGHVALPDGSGGWRQPIDQYASDRVLGRVAILMKDSSLPVPASEGAVLKTAASSMDPLQPIGYLSNAHQSTTDLAMSSIAEWRLRANAAYDSTPAPSMNAVSLAGPMNWFRPMEDGADPNSPVPWRAWCNPTVTRPIDNVKLAQTTPYFVGRCTQFIVEYAGDFLDQDEDDANEPGKIVDAKAKVDTAKLASGTMEIETDTAVNRQKDRDQIDYIIDTSADPTNAEKWVRRVRWYGLPRDVDGDGKIGINDVLPLADVMAYASVATPGPATNLQGRIAPWEDFKALPFPGGMFDNPSKTFDYATANISPERFRYTCAWHNDGPAMIRITMKIDDATGRLPDGQWYQYILTR